MPETIHPIDRHVGGHLRRLRIQKGLSQTALGEMVGVTFQQLQKYEKGSNRVSASRLFDLASVLGVPVSTFFEGAKGEIVRSEDGEGGAIDSLDLQMVKAFATIQDRTLKSQILKMVQRIGSKDRK